MNFTYYTDRRQNPTAVNTRRDGTFLMSLFNWQEPLLNHCDSNWVRVKEVTEYNGYNYEVENRDPLGIYSSALYSYSGKLPIAVGANTHNAEFGFEGFEEYQNATPFNQYQNATGNIDITTSNLTITSGTCETSFNYIPMNGLSFVSGITCIYPANLSSVNPFTQYTGCNISTIAQQGINGNCSESGLITVPGFTVNSIPGFGISSGFNSVFFLATPGYDPFGLLSYSPAISYTGWLGIPYQVCEPSSISSSTVSNAGISDSKAHTGSHSLEVTDVVSFAQPHLSFLNKSEQYQFSAWISRDDANANVSSYGLLTSNTSAACGVEILAYDSSSNLLGSIGRFYPAGSMINKWQKIEGSFSLNYSKAKYIAIKFYPGTTAPAYTTTATAYFDDIRIFPSRGNMKSYVYNNKDYKLAGVLDDNNYATLYYYDEEGQLYLTKQETEKGIFTVQEARENMPR